MELEEIKKEMREFKDFYGGSLLNFSDIDLAETKEQLAEIIHFHSDFLESQSNDAQSSLTRFKNRIGLSDKYLK